MLSLECHPQCVPGGRRGREEEEKEREGGREEEEEELHLPANVSKSGYKNKKHSQLSLSSVPGPGLLDNRV